MSIEHMTVEIKAVKDGDGEFEAVLSMPTKDRDGEVVDSKAFDPLPDHMPIDIDHGMSVVTTVASGTPFYDGDVLKFRGRFASTPLAQDVRTLVLEGHIRKMSVAFMNPQRETKDGTTHVTQAELLNAAIVAIPSNREATITAAKQFLAVVNADAPETPTVSDDTKTSTDPDVSAAPAALSPALVVMRARLARIHADMLDLP